MVSDENLHAGHRERMLNKFAENPNAFSDYEILEMLLFYFIPRKNTNGIAHKLIRAFGTIDRVFVASYTELKSVDGVGEKTAKGLLLISKIITEIRSREKEKPVLFNYSAVKENLSAYFSKLKDEKFLLLLLDKKYKEITKIEFTDENTRQVTAEIPEIAKAFALHKPSFAIIAHNHPSGSAEPSLADNLTTKKINLLCEVHGVTLVDHIIFTKYDSFSYNDKGQLKDIKKVADLNKILTSQGDYQ